MSSFFVPTTRHIFTPLLADANSLTLEITNGQNGILVNIKDPKNIAAAILSLYEDQSFYEKIKRNATATAKLFGWEALIERYLNVFSQAIKK